MQLCIKDFIEEGFSVGSFLIRTNRQDKLVITANEVGAQGEVAHLAAEQAPPRYLTLIYQLASL